MKTRFLLVGVAVLVGLALLVGEYAVASDGDGALFPDPNLELVIREAIGKPTGEITPADLVGLTELEAPNRGITNLEGLQYCKELTRVDLGYEFELISVRTYQLVGVNSNEIVNLSPISGLTKLARLYLSRNQITNILPLGGLTKIERLRLERNLLDLTPSFPTMRIIKLFQDRGAEVTYEPQNLALVTPSPAEQTMRDESEFFAVRTTPDRQEDCQCAVGTLRRTPTTPGRVSDNEARSVKAGREGRL